MSTSCQFNPSASLTTHHSRAEKNLKHVAVLGKDHYPYFLATVTKLFKKVDQLDPRTSTRKLQVMFQRIDALKLRASNHEHASDSCNYHDLMLCLDKLRNHLQTRPHLVPVRNGTMQGSWATKSALNSCMALYQE